jgi:hypothetical protein
MVQADLLSLTLFYLLYRLDDQQKKQVIETLKTMACVPSEVRPSTTATVDSRAAVASLVISSNAPAVKKVWYYISYYILDYIVQHTVLVLITCGHKHHAPLRITTIILRSLRHIL